MASESSPMQYLENVNIPREIDAPLNSSTTSVPSIITISDNDDENNFDSDVIVIDSDEVDEDENNFDGDVIVIDSDEVDEDENEMNRKLLNRYDRRLKYKMRRAINILLRYNSNLSEKDISYLENKKDEMRCKKSNGAVENLVNCVSRVESERLRSEKQNLRGLVTLRRRYLEAIRSSYEILKTWLSYDKNDCASSNDLYMKWASPFILKNNYSSVARSRDGEIMSNELDKIIQNIDFSDSELSGYESDTSSVESEHSFNDIYFYNDEVHQRSSPNLYYSNDITYKQNIIRQQRLQQRKQRLKRRQRLRNRFKIIHGQFYNGDGKFRASPLSGHFGEEKYYSNIPTSTSIVDRVEPLQPYVHTIIQGADVSLENNDRKSVAQIITAATKANITPAPDDQESCFNDELPYRRDSRRIVETNSLSSETATPSSHAITNNLLATPVMLRVQRRSRSRTRNHGRPRRFCSVSPPSSRALVISQEQMRRRSRSPLSMPGSPTRSLVPTIPIPRL